MSIVAADRIFYIESGNSLAYRVISMRLPPATVTIAFDLDRKLDGQNTISSAAITEIDPDPDAPLTIASETINQEQVSAQISDWTAERRYRLKCEATLADGSVISVEGRCEIINS